jgi:hypothetical protein
VVGCKQPEQGLGAPIPQAGNVHILDGESASKTRCQVVVHQDWELCLLFASMTAESRLTGVGEVHDEVPLLFSSRRSPVLSRNGIVSSSQPLATAAGLRILQNVSLSLICPLNEESPTP